MKTDIKHRHIRFEKKKFHWHWAYLLLPFYYIYLGVKWLWDNLLVYLFCETKQTKWNGVFGPGGTTYSYHEFSWGKTAFVIALISLILIIIYII